MHFLCSNKIRYARALKRPYLFGKHSNGARNEWFQRFRYSPSCMTLFVSKIGDNSIDLPGANVLIQITFMFGSRRQEAQRLGRLLRPKGKLATEEYNGFFYSLISQDTREMHFSTKRQQFLIKQGYSFKLIQNLPMHDLKDGVLSTAAEQKQLLTRVLTASDAAIEEEKIRGEGREEKNDRLMFSKTKNEDDYAKPKKGASRKSGGSLAARSGGTQRQYVEHFSHASAFGDLRKL